MDNSNKDEKKGRLKRDLQSNQLKSQLDKLIFVNLIQKDDIHHFRAVNPLDLLCNLKFKCENYTALHYCAYYNSFKLASFFIKTLRKKLNIDIASILNCKDSENGCTPIMISAIRNSRETFLIFLSENVIEYDAKNKDNLNLEELCLEYSPACLSILKRFINKESNLTPSLKVGIIEFEKLISDETYFETEISKNQVRHRISQIQRTNMNNQGAFVDEDFIIKMKNTPLTDITKIKKRDKIKWISHAEILRIKDGQTDFFDETWDLENIKQEQINNCYIIAALISLSQYPSIVMRMFDLSELEKGLIKVKLFDRGIQKIIVIDTLIPSINGKYLFSSTKNKDIWPIMIEKAFAKLYGSYFSLEFGYADEVFETLLGCPTAQIMINQLHEESIWKFLSFCLQNKYLICITTVKNASEISSFTSSHSFAAIDLIEYKDLKLIKIRDPEGKMNWKGEFSKKIKAWKKDLEKEQLYLTETKGLFFITLEELQKYFAYISVAFNEFGYIHNHTDLELASSKDSFVMITLEDQTRVFFRAIQEDLRKIYHRGMKNSEYFPIELLLAKLEDKGEISPIVRVHEKLDPNAFWGARSIYITEEKFVILEKGEYVIRIKPQSEIKNSIITFSSYSNRELKLSIIQNFENFLEKYFCSLASKSPKLKEIKPGYQKLEEFYSDYLYFYFKNEGTKIMKIKFEIISLQNLTFLDEDISSKKEITVPINSSATTVLKKISRKDLANYKMKWTYNFE